MAARLPNPGNPSAGENLSRVVDTNFPSGDVTVTYQIKFVTDRTSSFQTYFSIGPTSFSGGNTYYVTFDGDGGVSNDMAFGEADTPGGPDHYTTQAPTTGVWWSQGFQRSGDPGTLTYWYDLANGTANVTDTKFTSGAKAWSAGHVLMFGSDPWANTVEDADCWMRYLKVWSRALTEADTQIEASSGAILTSATSLWGQWPCNLDANDISGNARHLTASGGVTFLADDVLESPSTHFQRVRLRRW